MKPYCDLDALGKKARKASGKINCEKCPAKVKCDLLTFDVCTYVFEEGFRKGYNQRKKEGKSNEETETRADTAT